MSLEKIKKQIDNLRAAIREADFHYYVLNDPQISDKEYDDLLNKLKNLEKEYPQLITSDSPTQRVSGELIKQFPAIKHKVQMLSLDNTYSIKELSQWEEKIKRLLKKDNDFNYTAELKIDGISCSLIYQNGSLTKGLTRGDGKSGEDITPNLKTIASLPLKLRGDFPKTLEVRAEAYINKKDFHSLNSQRLKAGKSLFANPRNAAGGSLKLLDPKLTAERGLNCLVHSFGWVEGYHFETQFRFLEKIQEWGLPVQKENKFCENLNQVIDYCAFYQKKRKELPYEADGVVVKINSLSLQKKLGTTTKSPRWAVAYKFPAVQRTTRIKNVNFSLGRTGIITPVAILEPVECAGAVIRKATLHNFDEIKRLNLCVGDIVLLERAGDVIPKIVKVIASKRSGCKKKITPPEKCPVCQGTVNKKDVYYFCLNPNCPKKLKRSLMHFASRAAMDIEGLGQSLAEELVNRKLVKDLAGLYKLSKEELLSIPLFKEKKAQNLLKALAKSKNQPLNRLLFGLGLPHIGEKAATTLADRFGSIDKIMHSSKDELESIPEIGPIMAESILKFFSQKTVQKTIKELKQAGIKTQKSDSPQSNRLSGKTFVFTGQLKTLSRIQAQQKVEEAGAKWSSSLSKKTDFLVAGKEPGSKYTQAREKGVEVISEENFLKLIS